jgi:hypothetical protein
LIFEICDKNRILHAFSGSEIADLAHLE